MEVAQEVSKASLVATVEALLAKVKELPEQPALPLWDDAIHIDEEKSIAWRDIFAEGMTKPERVRVSIEDADLLSDENGDSAARRQKSRLSLTCGTSADSRLEVRKVEKGGRGIAGRILERFAGPRPEGKTADHYPDTDPLNNTRPNLRWATQAEQNMNQRVRGVSRFFGVHREPRGGLPFWRPYLRVTGTVVRGLRLPVEVEAARAVDRLIKLHNTGHRTNVQRGLLPPLEEQPELPLVPASPPLETTPCPPTLH